MGRNIQVKKEICSTGRMRVSDDESYDSRCNESTSQGLNCRPNPLESIWQHRLLYNVQKVLCNLHIVYGQIEVLFGCTF